MIRHVIGIVGREGGVRGGGGGVTRKRGQEWIIATSRTDRRLLLLLVTYLLLRLMLLGTGVIVDRQTRGHILGHLAAQEEANLIRRQRNLHNRC